jgi:hypothetical protein
MSSKILKIQEESEGTESDTKSGPLSAVQSVRIIASELVATEPTNDRQAVRISCTLTRRTFARVC